METKSFLTALEDEKISAAIGDAEKQTSGEIRVFVANEVIENPVVAAQQQFEKLGMTRTERRNGVLIYFAPKCQSYAIIGDKGLHEKCGQDFWEDITKGMNPLLKEGKFTEAIVYAVREAGRALSKHFPWEKGDRNELPNSVARDGDQK